MLCASPLVHAQRTSLSERVAALESRAAAGQNGSELVNQITQLREENQTLRGLVEQLQQQLEQTKQSQRAQYLDLSGRLDRLEGGSSAPTSSVSVPSNGTPVAAVPVTGTPMPAAPAADPGMASMGERSAYDYAFDSLRSGDYVESSRRFRSFLDTFPGGQLAPNAMYWLGESYYVTQNYQLAGQQFQDLLGRFPTDAKAPGALLKLGLSQYGLKQYPTAEATLRSVVQQYPGTDVARTAADRLHSMQTFGTR